MSLTCHGAVNYSKGNGGRKKKKPRRIQMSGAFRGLEEKSDQNKKRNNQSVRGMIRKIMSNHFVTDVLQDLMSVVTE